MLRKVAFGLAGLAAIGFAAPALAATSTEEVLVNIEVVPTVGIWSSTNNVSLVLDGGAVNEDLVETTLSRINNVTATLKVKATTSSFPISPIPGGGINFFVFYNVDEATALANMLLNNYGPDGSVGWLNGNFGAEYTIGAFGATASAITVPVTYAANNPGDLADVGNWNVNVLWTFTDTP